MLLPSGMIAPGIKRGGSGRRSTGRRSLDIPPEGQASSGCRAVWSRAAWSSGATRTRARDGREGDDGPGPTERAGRPPPAPRGRTAADGAGGRPPWPQKLCLPSPLLPEDHSALLEPEPEGTGFCPRRRRRPTLPTTVAPRPRLALPRCGATGAPAVPGGAGAPAAPRPALPARLAQKQKKEETGCWCWCDRKTRTEVVVRLTRTSIFRCLGGYPRLPPP